MIDIFKKNNNMKSISIDPDVYTMIKIISDKESKDFSEVIREALQGKTITL